MKGEREGKGEGKGRHTGYCSKPVPVTKQHTIHVTLVVCTCTYQFEVKTIALQGLSALLCVHTIPSSPPLPPQLYKQENISINNY